MSWRRLVLLGEIIAAANPEIAGGMTRISA